jgi:hypothetical protein
MHGRGVRVDGEGVRVCSAGRMGERSRGGQNQRACKEEANDCLFHLESPLHTYDAVEETADSKRMN